MTENLAVSAVARVMKNSPQESSIADWAAAVRVFDVLLHPSRSEVDEPRVLVQRTTQNTFLIDAPRELFSSLMPQLGQLQRERDLLPIDVLFGTYFPKPRAVKIYHKNIRHYAQGLKVSYEDLLQIIRLHEYGHAITHLGFHFSLITRALETMKGGQTDQARLLRKRTSSFNRLDQDAHEFLAQLITFVCLRNLGSQANRSRLLDVYDKLEQRQPEQYVIPDDVKGLAAHIDFSLLIRTAQGEVDVVQGNHFPFREKLMALAREFDPLKPSADGAQLQMWEVPFDESAADELRQALVSKQSSANQTEFLVDRFSNFKVEVFAREHAPPHFKVTCGERSGNFKIGTCEQINGDLRPKETRIVEEWHLKKRSELIRCWNTTRPTDCPVGPFLEP